jgi:hypothetical protein
MTHTGHTVTDVHTRVNGELVITITPTSPATGHKRRAGDRRHLPTT